MKQLAQNKFLVLLVAVLLVANLALMLYFFVFRHKDERGRSPQGPVSDFVQKKLGFNADQAAKFQELRDQHREAMKPIIDDIKKLKDSLYNLLRNPGRNDSASLLLANRIGEKQKEWELMIFHHFEKVRAICDSSQLPKFDSLVHQMINRGPWMRKKRPPQK